MKGGSKQEANSVVAHMVAMVVAMIRNALQDVDVVNAHDDAERTDGAPNPIDDRVNGVPVGGGPKGIPGSTRK